jgi:negative regulator of flagellin synthesis FlgM
MKVTGYTTPDLTAPKAPSAHTPKADTSAAKTATSASADPGVAVVVTNSTRTKDVSAQSAVIDTKKVAAMKAAIQDGSFKVNPEAIADKLLSNAQELYQTTQK